MNWPVALGSLVGVLALVGLARWLRLGADPRLGDDTARALIAAHEFTVDRLYLDRAGIAALATCPGGGFVLVRQHGARFVVEELTLPLAARLDHDLLTIGTGRRAVTLDLGADAPAVAASLRRLASGPHRARQGR